MPQGSRPVSQRAATKRPLCGRATTSLPSMPCSTFAAKGGSSWRLSRPVRFSCRASIYARAQSQRSNRLGDDTGSATLIAVAMIAVLLAITVGGFYLGSAVVARHRAQAAADLSALAAASALAQGVEAACSRAALIANAMNVAVTDCTVDNLDVVITIQVGKARAAARAGPV